VISVDAIRVREIFPGIRARIVHTDRTSQSWIELDQGTAFPTHQHPHEQTVNVLEGQLELMVDGQLLRLSAGQTCVIPPDIPHSGRALTPCRVLDVFAPARDDYR
jgi:unsaturated pyranuronate lyase